MNDTDKTDTPAATPAAAAPKLVKVQLASDHTHHGIAYAAGEVIEVVERVAKWIEAHTIGKRYTGPDKAANASN